MAATALASRIAASVVPEAVRDRARAISYRNRRANALRPAFFFLMIS
jgi:hypothetical protein